MYKILKTLIKRILIILLPRTFYNYLPIRIKGPLRVSYLDRNLFLKKRLLWDQKGFYSIYPMPTKKDLDLYYSSLYWGARSDSKELLNQRDIWHFEFFSQRYSLGKSGTAINFGSGHGGISYLLAAAGWCVINIDPSDNKVAYESRISKLSDLSEVEPKSVDFFYASHSLEHVTDINEIISQIYRIAKPGCFVMIEVPNAAMRVTKNTDLSNGGADGKIRPPHTFYFTKAFFEAQFPDANVMLLSKTDRQLQPECSASFIFVSGLIE